MKLAGVIGWPVAQSLSPRLHGYWLEEHGIDGAYVALPVRPEDFSTALRGLRLSGFRGVSVTVPHKEAAFAIAHSVDAQAAQAGAVNQLLFGEDDRIRGLNTDAPGLAASVTTYRWICPTSTKCGMPCRGSNRSPAVAWTPW